MSITTDIQYWTLTLKVWIAGWVNDNAHKEDYGEEECECCWKKLMLATNLVDELQCYQVSSSYNIPAGAALPTPDPCLKDSDVQHLFQLASSVINFRTKC